MKIVAAIICFCHFQCVLGQDSITVLRKYENDKPVTAFDSGFHKVKNAIFISFDEGFNDSCYITVNGIPFINAYLKTDESIGLATSFGLHFKDSSDSKILTIKFVKAKSLHTRAGKFEIQIFRS